MLGGYRDGQQAFIKALKISHYELYVGPRLQHSNLSFVIEVLINKAYCGFLRKTGWVGWDSWGRKHFWEPLCRDGPTHGSPDGPSWIISFQWSFERGSLKIVCRKVSTLGRLGVVVPHAGTDDLANEDAFQSTKVFSAVWDGSWVLASSGQLAPSWLAEQCG